MGGIAGGGLHEDILRTMQPISLNGLMTGYQGAQDRLRAIAMQQAQKNAIETETAQRQQAIDENAKIAASQSKLQELLVQPQVQAQVARGDYSALATLHPTVANAARTNLDSAAQSLLTRKKEQNEINLQGRKDLGEVLNGIDQVDDPAAKASMLAARSLTLVSSV